MSIYVPSVSRYNPRTPILCTSPFLISVPRQRCSTKWQTLWTQLHDQRENGAASELLAPPSQLALVAADGGQKLDDSSCRATCKTNDRKKSVECKNLPRSACRWSVSLSGVGEGVHFLNLSLFFFRPSATTSGRGGGSAPLSCDSIT